VTTLVFNRQKGSARNCGALPDFEPHLGVIPIPRSFGRLRILVDSKRVHTKALMQTAVASRFIPKLQCKAPQTKTHDRIEFDLSIKPEIIR